MIEFIIYGVCAFIFLWLLYVNVMIQMARIETKPLILRVPIYLLLAVGYILDVILNITFTSVFLLELPRELTVTSRLKRILLTQDGWRFKVALFACMKLLEPWDPNHCGLSGVRK